MPRAAGSILFFGFGALPVPPHITLRFLLQPGLLLANLPLQSASGHEQLDVKSKPLIGGMSRCSQGLGNDRPSFPGTPASLSGGLAHLALGSFRALPSLLGRLFSPEIRVVANDPSHGLPRRLCIDPALAQLLGKCLAPAVQIGLARIEPLAVLGLGLARSGARADCA